MFWGVDTWPGGAMSLGVYKDLGLASVSWGLSSWPSAFLRGGRPLAGELLAAVAPDVLHPGFHLKLPDGILEVDSNPESSAVWLWTVVPPPQPPILKSPS